MKPMKKCVRGVFGSLQRLASCAGSPPALLRRVLLGCRCGAIQRRSPNTPLTHFFIGIGLTLLMVLLIPHALGARQPDWKHYDVRIDQEDLRIHLPPDWKVDKNSLSEFAVIKDAMTIRVSHAFRCNPEFKQAEEKLSQYLSLKLVERNIEKTDRVLFATYRARELIYKPGLTRDGVSKEGWREVEIVDGHGHNVRFSGPDKDIKNFLNTFHEISKEITVYNLCNIRND